MKKLKLFVLVFDSLNNWVKPEHDIKVVLAENENEALNKVDISDYLGAYVVGTYDDLKNDKCYKNALKNASFATLKKDN